MREAYRLNKYILSDADKSYQLAINYIDKQHQDYTVIHKAMQRALTRLTQTTTNEP